MLYIERNLNNYVYVMELIDSLFCCNNTTWDNYFTLFSMFVWNKCYSYTYITFLHMISQIMKWYWVPLSILLYVLFTFFLNHYYKRIYYIVLLILIFVKMKYILMWETGFNDITKTLNINYPTNCEEIIILKININFRFWTFVIRI